MSALSPELVDRVAQALLDAFDPRFGGFGTGGKFPHPEALDFVLLYAEKSGNPAFREMAQKTLTALAEGGLRDSVEGGFFGYCATRDWRQPTTEKRLETQAGLLRNFLEGWQLFGRPEFRKTAQQTLSYIGHVLRDPATGAWFSSQDGDDAYYALSARERADRKPPRVEPAISATSLCATISALLKAGVVLGDEMATSHAQAGVRFLVETLSSPGRGVYHRYDGARRILGRLVDQVYAVRALLHVVQYTGDNERLGLIEDLIEVALRKESRIRGGFYDLRDDDPGFEAARQRPSTLLENGLFAEALVRAHCLTGRAEYRALAERTLTAFATDFQSYGYLVAEYGRAVELFCHPPQRIFVVGARGTPASDELLGVARRTYAPSKLVLALDPVADADLLARHGLAAGPIAAAHLFVEGGTAAVVTDPAELPAAMARAEQLRSRR